MIVYTGGTFDLLHVGHLELLRACREIAGPFGAVVASVNPDDFIERYKGRPPVQSLAHRLEAVRAVRFVDAAVVNVGGEDSSVAIEVVAPDVLAIGDDWLDEGGDETRYLAQLGVSREWMTRRGLSVVYVPRTRGVASRVLREGVR